MKNSREIEQLSLYLDGQLDESESKRLETRLTADLELASVLNDIRLARGILRSLPARKAPRNFTLTRKMAGIKPPLPRAYPFFRFSTAFATILLMLTFAANSLPRMSFGFGAAAPAVESANGIGGGGGCEEPCQESFQAAATEAPAVATEAPAVEAPVVATEAPVATEPPAFAEAPPVETAVQSTLAAETAREESPSLDAMQTPKEAETESAIQDQPTLRAKRESVIPIAWQVILLVVIALSILMMWLMQKSASRKWQ
ncbi:MAG: hypothetical protein HZB18_12760 [Chloroflexi bacterium]|nr:hypothetical protein [Chloroflexota bacterium]